MKILVTGACGFVGRWIVQGLLDSIADVQIIGLDNLSRAGSEQNRKDLAQLGVRFVHGDLRLSSDIDSLPTTDWVIDSAALPSVLAGTRDYSTSRQLMEHNLFGSINLLEYCRARQSGLVMLSTSRVYSINPLLELPLVEQAGAYCLQPNVELPSGISSDGIDESFTITPPVSLYGATKIASEVVAREYAEAFQFPLRINRCGVLAGAGQFGKAAQGIFSFWIHSHLSKRPLKFIGGGGKGLQVRDCLHPIDIAQLVRQQILAGIDLSKPMVVNASGGINSATSLFQLTQWCNRQFGEHAIASSDELRPYDLPWVVLDNSLAKEVWQWQPTMDCGDILEEIAQHARGNKDWLTQCE